jgi:pimeloyl-ACP methyl ester carboxylesterase
MGARVGRTFCSRVSAWCLAAAIVLACVWSNPASATEPRVLLLRGWFGVFSTGLDGIADALKANGINAEVAGHLYWETAVADIIRERAEGKVRPLVLVGHSQGANNVIDMARALQAHNIKVDLLVTLAPFMQNPLPANVVHAIDYYQSPGWGAPLVPDNGFHGVLQNINMDGDWGATHMNVDKNPRVQNQILREVVTLARAPAPSTKVSAARH